ncbi:TetR/AcrR family transcriptional regulator [Aliamphritea ceti]|uniref:TetR/AcrR family transcriptional regulator n=1 Tax=Aliamphritea ceti TaxID=1524258 RepID=UPI0021C2C8DF|nr:TetR/AcrR family transcriptional regulator [Aliamphritea ceti]
MARRNDHTREELHEMALAAAQVLLDEQGVTALSTRKVAAAIGYSVGSLYQLFNNLDDLCWQLNARTLAQFQGELSAIPEGEPREIILGYGRAYLEFAHKWPHRWHLLFEHKSQASDIPDALQGKISGMFEYLEAALAQQFPQANAESLQRSARTLWAAVHGIAVLASLDKLFLNQPALEQQMLNEVIGRYLSGWQQENMV